MKSKSSSSYNNILKYTGLLGGVQVFYVLMAVVRNKFTAFFIGAAGMGLADLYFRTIELMGNATNFGIAFSAVRRLSELHDVGDERATHHYVRLIRSWTLLTALLGAAVCLLLSPLLSRLTMGHYGNTAAYALLSPAVAFTTLAAGELAVLKGLRQLKTMAAISALAALATLVITVPLYWGAGLQGIIPVLVLTAAVTFLINLRAASRQVPYRVSPFRLRLLRMGGHLIRLGGAYIVAGICGAGVEMAVRTCLMRLGGPTSVGLYAAGFTLTVSYARILLISMDADYYPRLAAAMSHHRRMNITINRQINVLVLLMVPFLIAFVLCLPLIVRVLYTADFLAIVPMVICAAAYMYFKAVFSPVAYLPLAAGHSATYMLMELAYDLPFVAFVVVGYHYGGLVGAGIGLSLSNLYNLLLVVLVYARRYGYRPDWGTCRRTLIQGLLLLGGLIAAWQPNLVVRFGTGTAILLASLAVSWRLLGRETALGDTVQRLAFWKKKNKRDDDLPPSPTVTD